MYSPASWKSVADPVRSELSSEQMPYEVARLRAFATVAAVGGELEQRAPGRRDFLARIRSTGMHEDGAERTGGLGVEQVDAVILTNLIKFL